MNPNHWLVYTVASLIVSIGLTLFLAAWNERIAPEIIFLGMASAIALATIDFIYVARHTISPIYLADAAIETLVICGWLAGIAIPAGRRR